MNLCGMCMILDRYRTIQEMVRGREVLDVGCVDHSIANRKHGHWLHDVIMTTARRVVGLDYEAESVAVLQREGYDVRCADATAFDLGERFDVVVAGEVLEHLTDPGAFLRCARRHLHPDGRLVMTTPNAHGAMYILQSLVLGHEVDNLDHVSFFTPRTIRALLAKCGFQVERTCFIAGFVPLGHHHAAAQVAAWVKNVVKLPIYALRPSLCHRFLTVARPVPEAGAPP